MNETFSYREAVDYLYRIPKFTKKAPLAQTELLLERLGISCDLDKPAIIHVAGTNGKGSVCADMESMLRAAGFTTGLFTSPHLVKPEERIRVNAAQISKESFTAYFQKVCACAQQMEQQGMGHPTFFSFLLAMGMLAFQEHDVDYIILETGMGGRLDGTNVFRHPVLTVITSIGMDHTEYLGDTLEKIAWEKAGIIKPGTPLVYLKGDAAAVLEARGEELGCLCRGIEKSAVKIIKKSRRGIDFSLRNRYDDTALWHIPFRADYQVENAALAIEGMEMLFTDRDHPVLPEAFHRGLSSVRWEGRMEEVAEGVYLDGAHNLPGILALSGSLESIAGEYPGKRVLLFSAVRDKQYAEMFFILNEKFRPDVIVFTELSGERGLKLEELMQLTGTAEGGIKNTSGNIYGISDPAKAFDVALQKKGGDGILLCTGSLYLIGALKGLLSAEE